MTTLKRATTRLSAVAAEGLVPADAETEGIFTGYGTVFDIPDLDGDVIAPGAFRDSLKRLATQGGPRLLWQHDPTQPIGVWTEVVEDARGLKMTGRLALDTQRGAEAFALLKLGALDGLSLGFTILQAERDSEGRRRITCAELHECSPVTFPCQPAARVQAVKSATFSPDRAGDTAMDQSLTDTLNTLTTEIATVKSAVAALNRPNLEPGNTPGLGRLIRALAAGRGDPERAAAFATKSWGDGYTAKALEAGTGSAGGFIVPEPQIAEIAELLRPASVVRRLGATVVPMPNGTLLLAKLAGGSQADYIGENSPISASQPNFTQVRLTARKLAALVPVSNDLIRYAGPTADQVVRDDLVAALAQRQDLAFLYGDGTGNSPKGLRHWASQVFAANPSGTLDAIVSDLGEMVLALRTSGARMLRPAWIMAPKTEQALMNVRDESGQFVFRAEMLTGKLQGFPYASTLQVAVAMENNEEVSDIFLVDMADAVIGEAAGLVIDASGEAAYQAGSAVVPAFSLDQTVIRCITAHDFVMRHEKSVVVMTNVTWAP
ncbi:phage major capsid protein [Lacibacterium aquatile]|uniref:Phage major capsid protein n=1 Tax=Lacibacterium aquatile TaxID=1168082 RepID=A0ABW5DT65_9PROT